MVTYEEKLARARVYNARYYAKKVQGTLGATESPDIIITSSVREALEVKFLRALMKRDAKIWAKHANKHDSWMGPPDESEPETAHTAGHMVAHAAPTAKQLKERSELAAAKKASALARVVAVANAQKRYEGMPCKNCGGTTRFVGNSDCVRCSKSRNIRKAAAKIAAKNEIVPTRHHMPDIGRAAFATGPAGDVVTPAILKGRRC